MLDLSTIPMYRGARNGDPSSLTGPSYFISSETFAKTYGKTAAFTLNLNNPLIVPSEEWDTYANSAWNPIEDVIAHVEESGHDSVVNVRKTPTGELYTVFLLNPSQAQPLKESMMHPRMKMLIKELSEPELNSIQIGDMLDVDMEYEGIYRVRVTELLDDVSSRSGLDSEPGFVGKIEKAPQDPPNEGVELVFGLSHIVPGSKAKYFFPDAGNEYGEDDYGRPMNNPYRKMASRKQGSLVGESIERYAPGQLSRDYEYFFEAKDYIELPHEEILALINSKNPEDIADSDYVSVEEGEVMWEKGEAAKTTGYHNGYEQIKVDPNSKKDKDIWIDGYDTDERIWNFENQYDVTMSPLSDFINSEEMGSHDYDLEQSVPVTVKRMDAAFMSEQDEENVIDYIESWNDQRLTNIELEAHGNNGTSMIISPMFK